MTSQSISFVSTHLLGEKGEYFTAYQLSGGGFIATWEEQKSNTSSIVYQRFDDDAQADHVGICASNDGKKYLTVYEGNTSGDNKGSQSNGDGVFLKKRAYSLVMGVARP